MRVPAVVFVVSSLALCMATGEVWAGEPQVEPVEQDPLIANGSPAPTCAWPTAVSVSSGGGLCTGTLIHPQVVVYAAHCGGGNKTIRFSEDAFGGGQTSAVAFCVSYPEYAGTNDQGHDWSFCRLQNPVTELAVTPAPHGSCETSILNVGQEIGLAGFGQTLSQNAGIKNWGTTTLAAVNMAQNVTVIAGNGSSSICPGDSGGPAFVRFPDGGWRAFGIASTVSGGCGGSGTHSIITGAIPWIEAESQIDVTPCTTSDGSWAPGADCGGFNASEPGQGSGSWADWCSGTPTSPDSTVCGPAWNQFDASLPPTVAITYPVWGEMFPEGASIDIAIDAFKDPAGPAIKEIRLEINGGAVATDGLDPYGFAGAQFVNPGVYELVAVAEDWMGNIVMSDPVAIGIGDAEVPPEPTDEGDEGDEGDGDGGSAEAGDGEDMDDGATDGLDFGADDGASADGCSVVANTRASGWGLALFGLILLGVRRRQP